MGSTICPTRPSVIFIHTANYLKYVSYPDKKIIWHQSHFRWSYLLKPKNTYF